MKKTVITLLLCAAAGLAYGQGQVTVSTAKNGSYVRFTNTVAGVYAGQAGSANIVWGLYYGADAAHLNNLLYYGTNSFYAGTLNTFKGTILESAGVKTLATAPGVSTTFQLKAWSAGYATYEDAMASGLSSVLVSKTFPTAVATPSDPTAQPPPTPPTIAWAPGSVSATAMIVELVPVPEPSIIALAGLGLASLIFIRRRK